ncbi:MAG: barnase inhibitor [Erysipelotrichaceae bacterium]|nr:barnase inhibitor [Erysipelotrichaceae bacterium]
MMELILDGRLCVERTQTHLLLKELLSFPDYYGMNLDALYDCASTLSSLTLHVMYWDVMVEHLGNYGHLILTTLAEAAEENPGFDLILEEINEDDVEI